MTQQQSPRIHTLDNAKTFTINGWTPFGTTESSVFFEQASATLSVLISTVAMQDTDERGPLNSAIIESAMHGVQTLLSLGLLASDNEAKKRQQQREAR